VAESQKIFPEAGLTDDAQSAPVVLYVTGASRSGTTLMSRILGQHSRVHSSNELHYFGDLFDIAQDREASTVLDHTQATSLSAKLLARERAGVWRGTPEEGDQLLAQKIVQSMIGELTGTAVFHATIARVLQSTGADCFCEHTPRNIFYADYLLQKNPNAKIIHMIRDPRAVLASQKHRWKRRFLDKVNIPLRETIRVRLGFHPVTTTKLWQKATHAALSLEDNPRVMLVQYEDLVRHPEEVVARVAEFAGLRHEAAMTAIQKMGSSHKTSQLDQHGLTTESIERWRDSLSVGEIATCERLTTSLRQRFGYDSSVEPGTGKAAQVLQSVTLPLHLAGAAAIDPKRALIHVKALIRSRSAAARSTSP